MVQNEIFGHEGLIREVKNNRCWKAHCDTITHIVNLDEHGCIMTLSGNAHTYSLRMTHTLS